MPSPDVELARRPGVELIRTGSWSTMSGSWNPTPEDLAAAVEAQACAAIAKPIIKLGHVDSRFDGEPAMGYFENLRLSDGGHTLVGDQVTLPWLHSVQAAAYPSRSIEGNYNHTCGSGHKHRFVLTAVALLGVTPPAVKTIRRLNDIPAMLGVAASEPEVPDGAEHVQVTILAGRHSATDFDEAKHPRDHHGEFTHGGGSGVKALTKGAGPSPANGLKTDAKLAGRIPLGKGETYAGSASIPRAGIAAARVDTPDGPKLRIAFGINEEDQSRWSASNKGATTVLDQHGVDELRAAVPRMLDAGKQGKAQWKALNSEADKLDAAERAIVERQYPNLTAADKKELSSIDRKVADGGSRLEQLSQRQQQRIGAVPGPPGVELAALEKQIGDAHAAGDTGKVRKLRAQQDAILEANPDQRGVRAGLFRRDAAEADKLAPQLADLNARRADLTKVSVPLSASDQKQLAKVRADIAAHSDQMRDFGDGSVQASGSIPGDWGSVDWAVSMSTDEPLYNIRVTPSGGARAAAPEPLDPSDLRKLGALLDKAGAKTSDVKAAANPDDGDDDEPTGAMVALIPTADDASRLAVDGGEPAEELHLTLAYLGDASTLDASARQDLIDAVSSAVNGMPVVDADVFSAAVYNPGDTSDSGGCLVYQVTGDLLAAAQESLDDALGGMDQSPEPFFAHITALWSDDLGRLADLAANMGPVTFDRVRIAVAGQTVDIPLIDDADPVDPAEFDDDIQVPNILMPVAAASADKLRAYWVHGKGAAKIRWGEKNDFYRCVAQLRKFVADPKGLCNTYHRDALGVAPGQENVHASARPAPDLPAAEPEHEIPSEPKEDHVSDLSAFRSRLGLDDTADEQAILSALDELKTKADTPAPAEPTPEMVAASAAATDKATKAEAALELMKEELARQSGELATIKASAAATVKASFFGGLLTAGKLKPADRETWEARYDRDPEMVADILGARAEGSEVPVMASGSIGSPEPTVDDDFEALVARIDAPTGKAV